MEFPARSPTPANRSRTQDSVNQHHFLLFGVLRASRPVTVHLNEAPFVGMELEAGSDWIGIKPGTRLRVTYMRLHVEQPTQPFPRSMLHVVAVKIRSEPLIEAQLNTGLTFAVFSLPELSILEFATTMAEFEVWEQENFGAGKSSEDRLTVWDATQRGSRLAAMLEEIERAASSGPPVTARSG